MMSNETQNQVARLLLAISEGERSVEISRQVLSDNFDFDPFQVFNFLDPERKNTVDALNIVEFLRSKGIFASNEEAQMAILFYDQNGDGVLSYSEFLSLVQSDKSLQGRSNYSSPDGELSFNVDYSLGKLMEKEILNSRTILRLLNELRLRVDFNLHDIYHLLKGYTCITMDGIKNFFDSLNASYLESDLKAILKRLDFNRDGRIDICELHSFFGFPHCGRCCPCKGNCGCSCCSCCCMSTCLIHHTHHHHHHCHSPCRSCSASPERRSPSPLNNSGRLNTSGNNFGSSQPIGMETKVSPNLSLRRSPERKFSPSRTSPLRQSPLRQSNTFERSFNSGNQGLRKVSPNLALRSSPERKYSPGRSSPCRSCSPCRFCHCSPCCCCHPCSCSPCRRANNNISTIRPSCDYCFEKTQFVDFLRMLMDAEGRIERSKIDLALRADFNVEDAFRVFEIDGRGFITEADLMAGLNLLDLHPSNSEVRALMKRFDLGKQGIITYQDFFDIVTPFEKDYRNMVENRPPNSTCPCRCPDIFMYATRIYLKNLFASLIDYENKFNITKGGFGGLRSRIGCVYRDIDKFGNGYFTATDLANYLKGNFAFTTAKDADLLFIRLDRNRNGKVELWEIQEELMPSY
ncbi:MAG: EF-hand domain-containing protein [archaeon]|nr:EF-hand domain-containing protein [archaeon]